jgi:hypothetical protein
MSKDFTKKAIHTFANLFADSPMGREAIRQHVLKLADLEGETLSLIESAQCAGAVCGALGWSRF